MSLFVRVYTNYFTHRKTARLRLTLGNDAIWIPIRLWAYTAENQPDGNFDGYSAEELAMLVGYQHDAKAMLQALLDVGFMDANPLRVHDWQEHNSYHKTFAVRAKKAANARWKGQEKKVQDRKGKERSKHEPSMLQASERIYAEYPRKVGKPDALRAIEKALASCSEEILLERTKAYSVARSGEDQQFTPHPSTWFNQERWKDDPSTWSGGDSKPKTAPISVFNLKTVMEQKQKLADQIRNNHSTTDALSTTWDDQANREKYRALRGEIKELSQKLAGAL